MKRPVYCDESVWIPVANGLDKRGWTVYTAREEGMLGEPDRNHLSLVKENSWILLTFDDDFLGLVENQGLDHSGIILVNQVGKRVSELIGDVDKILRNWEGPDTIYYI